MNKSSEIRKHIHSDLSLAFMRYFAYRDRPTIARYTATQIIEMHRDPAARMKAESMVAGVMSVISPHIEDLVNARVAEELERLGGGES